MTSPYGIRFLNGVREFHQGIDATGLTDRHVCAVVPGVVAVSTIVTDKSNRTWEWGNYVRVDGDDGRRYYYCHLSTRLVEVGKRVAAGDHVGIEGNTGYSFGNHCHFEVRGGDGIAVNPAPFLEIPNLAGIYGTDYRSQTQKRFGLSDETMRYLDGYAYAADLYRKLCADATEIGADSI